jgi:hypothetical protein
MADRLADLAGELYGVPPAVFIAERTARAKEVADDTPLAARVRGLRKPAPAAWIVNLLVRSRRQDLEDLLAFGAELRAAQESLDRAQITRLVRERRSRVTALARIGADLAADAGYPVPAAVVDAVTSTLEAGLADAEAADAIRSGRLLRPLETIGFETVDLAEAIAVPEAGSRAARRRTVPERPRPHAIDDADAELRRARSRADAAVARAERDAAEAAAEFGDLDVRLREARKALAAAEREAETLQRQRDSADRTHGKARAVLDAALARRRDLG